MPLVAASPVISRSRVHTPSDAVAAVPTAPTTVHFTGTWNSRSAASAVTHCIPAAAPKVFGAVTIRIVIMTTNEVTTIPMAVQDRHDSRESRYRSLEITPRSLSALHVRFGPRPSKSAWRRRMRLTHTLVRSDFDEVCRVSTRWSDNDMFGHLNNAVYYELFDSAINAWMIRDAGVDETTSAEIGVVAESGCRFLRELAYPEPVDVAIRVARLGRSSITFELGLFAAGEDQLPRHTGAGCMSTSTGRRGWWSPSPRRCEPWSRPPRRHGTALPGSPVRASA